MPGKHYDWDAVIARLSAQPGRWRRELPDVPVRAAATVRLRRAAALRRTDGVLEGQLRNIYITDTGQKRGDLYLRWTPTGVR